eukprot:11173155-Lingulodinium_polyedra.AAC.1
MTKHAGGPPAVAPTLRPVWPCTGGGRRASGRPAGLVGVHGDTWDVCPGVGARWPIRNAGIGLRLVCNASLAGG